MKINFNTEQQNYVKNFGWILFDQVLKGLGGLFVQLKVIDYLGPQGTGELKYGISLVTIFLLFSSMGIDTIAVREVVSKPKLARFIYGASTGFRIIGGLLSFILVNLITFIINDDPTLSLIVFIISFQNVTSLFNTFHSYYKANVLYKYKTIADNIGYISSLCLKLILIYYNYSVIYIALTLVFDTLLSGIFKAYFYQKLEKDLFRWKFHWRIAKPLLINSLPIGLTLLLLQIHAKIDIFMITNMLSTKNTGIYSAAIDISDYFCLLPTVLLPSILPYFVKIKQNENFYNRRFLQIMTFVTWSTLILGIIIGYFSDFVIEFLLNKEFIESSAVLQISIWKVLFVSQGVLINMRLVNDNNQRYQLYTNLIGVTTNIILNYFLINMLGVIGAAISTLFTRIIINWVSPLLFDKARYMGLMSLKSLNPFNLLPK